MKVAQIQLIAEVPDDWNMQDVEDAIIGAFERTNHSNNDFNPLFVNEMEIEPEDYEEI